MLLGLGVDLIEKSRFKNMTAKAGTARRFTAGELAYAAAAGREDEALAAAFAAKEAFFKAASGLLDDSRGLFWQAELVHDINGAPQIKPGGEWQEKLAAAGVRQILLSITHDREQVLAAVILADAAEERAAAVLADVAPQGFVPLYGCAPVRLDEQLVAGWLPKRPPHAHKGDFGHVLVVGGSAAYPGAPRMAAEAALRSGAGLVTLAAPAGIDALSPEVILCPLYAPNGCLGASSAAALKARWQGKIPVIGMGLGRAAEVVELVADLAVLPGDKVLDADGLFALAEAEIKPRQAVLTPHSGEMARLLGCTVAEVEADRISAVRRAAVDYQAVVVLKGPATLVAAPDGRCYQNSTGNAGMATGGSGDVLAGLVGGLLAQGMQPLRAAAFGVYLHGLAGDLAAAAQTQYAMTALDIVRHLPAAYRRLLAAYEVAGDEIFD